MTPTLSRFGGGLADDDGRLRAEHRWPITPTTGPVRVYSQGVRLMKLEPSKDPRPHPLLALLTDLFGGK